jgi:hypothetical protein
MVKMSLGDLIYLKKQCDNAISSLSKMHAQVDDNRDLSVQIFNDSMSNIDHNFSDIRDCVFQLNNILRDVIDRVEITI